MSDRLATALPELFEALDRETDDLPGQVRRLQIGKKGIIHIEWQTHGAATWLAWACLTTLFNASWATR